MRTRYFLLAGYGLLLLLALTLPLPIRHDYAGDYSVLVGSLGAFNLLLLWRGPRRPAYLAGAGVVLGCWLLFSFSTYCYDECLDVVMVRFPALWGNPLTQHQLRQTSLEDVAGVGLLGGLLAETGWLTYWGWRWLRPVPRR